MDYVKLGNTGLDVSRICLGCMSFGSADGWVHNPRALNGDESRTIIKRALDLGINFFTSPIIGATKLHHLEDAIAASPSSLRLTRSNSWKNPIALIL